jgi:hypothetical protein
MEQVLNFSNYLNESDLDQDLDLFEESNDGQFDEFETSDFYENLDEWYTGYDEYDNILESDDSDDSFEEYDDLDEDEYQDFEESDDYEMEEGYPEENYGLEEELDEYDGDNYQDFDDDF